MELDLEAGVGLLRGDGEDAILDVAAVDVGHVGVPEAGEGAEAEAEAEEVASVELLEFLFGEEDNGLYGYILLFSDRNSHHQTHDSVTESLHLNPISSILAA